MATHPPPEGPAAESDNAAEEEEARPGPRHEPAAAPVPPPAACLLFRTPWVLWAHRRGRDYTSNIHQVYEMADVETFWRVFNNVCKPSQFFAVEAAGSGGRGGGSLGERRVEGLSLFRRSIRPEWEDPRNCSGGEWFVKGVFDAEQLDEWWLNTTLACVGETLADADRITGARVVDKSVGKRIAYRLELWFEGGGNVQGIRQSFHADLAQSSNGAPTLPELQLRGHGDEAKSQAASRGKKGGRRR